jgi:uncharacterized membrane protein YjjP (DUF1212 family)
VALDIAAAVLLASGSAVCAAAALIRDRHRLARLALAAALACAAAAALVDGADAAAAIAACVLAAAGAARMVLDQHRDVTRLS